MKILNAILSFVVLSAIAASPALALSERFEDAREQNLDKLSERFEDAREQNLDKKFDRSDEELQTHLEE